MHQIDDALRQANLIQDVADQFRGERNLLGRFKNERVAAHDGEGQKPHRHHGRKIEGRDGGADADGLANRLGVNAA